MTARLRVALLFGGRSAEHDVSVLSAGNVFRALDESRFEVVLIAVTREGQWLLCPGAQGAFPAAVPEDGPRVALLPGGNGALVVIEGGAARVLDPVDVLFPVLHGPFGEDGTVQGAASSPACPMSAPACSPRPPPWTRTSRSASCARLALRSRGP
jgi:D-alanine-D-alanine ligase